MVIDMNPNKSVNKLMGTNAETFNSGGNFSYDLNPFLGTFQSISLPAMGTCRAELIAAID